MLFKAVNEVFYFHSVLFSLYFDTKMIIKYLYIYEKQWKYAINI